MKYCLRLLYLLILFHHSVAIAVDIDTSTNNSAPSTTANQHPILTPAEQAWLKAHPEIIVGGGPDWTPFDFVNDNGQYSGIANDYLNLIAEKTGLKFKLEIDQWSNQLQKIRDKKIDILGAAYYLEEREQFVNFSTPYLEVLDYFFIRDDLNVKTLDDLNGKRVAIPEKYAHGDFLKQHYPKINIVTVDNFSAAIDAVLEDRADMLYDAYAAVTYVLKKEGINTIIPFKSTRELGANSIHIITRKDAPELTSIIQKSLDAISIQEKRDIYDRWLGKRPEVHKQQLDITEAEKQWLQQHKTIRFAGDPNWLPYEAIDRQGNYTGIVAEYLRLIEQKLGIKLDIISTQTWNESVEKTKRGEIDVLSETIDSDLRSHLTFTQPYVTSPVIIVMSSDENYVESINQIKHKKIALIKNYGYVPKIIKNYPDLNTIHVDSIQDGLTAVSTGKTDVLFATLAQASYHISKLGINNIRIVGKTEFNTQLAFGMQAEFAPLVPLFNRAIADISQNEKQYITEKWGEQKFATKTDYDLLTKIAAALLLIITIIAYWNRKLSKEVTRRKDVEAQTQTLIDTIPLQIIITSFEGNVLSANPQAINDYKVQKDDIFKLNISDFYNNPNDREAVIKELFEKGKIDQKIVPFKKTDGEVCSMMISIIPINYNDNKAFLTIAVDMTERLQLESALQNAKETAEAASYFKSQFLANMSHEIRTPMNAIIGMSHLALNTNLDNKQQDYIEKIKSSGQNLLVVINDILDFSKIEAGKLDIENTSFILDSLIDNLVNMIALPAEEKHLTIHLKRDLNIPNTLIGDPLRINQILLNLVQNAIKFTDSGEIIISVQLRKRRKNTLYLDFSVSDTGIGIEKEKLNNLFDAFVQADSSTTRRYGGTGLGLSISQQLVSLMGGKLNAESEIGKGSTFSFSLRLTAQQDSPLQTFNPVIALKDLRILLIDNNPTSQQVMVEILSSFSFVTTTATSAEQVYSLLNEANKNEQGKNQAYDLVLIDMHDASNIDIACTIKNNMALQNPPFVLLLATYGQEDIPEKVIKYDLDGFIIKPATPSSLFETICELFDRSVKKQTKEKSAIPKFIGKALLVEDNSINQQVAKEMLENLGLLVVIADSGEKAIQLVQQAEYDVIFMDVQMPGIDGFETTRQIRKKLINTHLPIIAMTAHAMAGDKESCLEAGMNDYLPKPIEPEALYLSLIPWLKAAKDDKQVIVQNTSSANKTINWDIDLPGINLHHGLSRIGYNERLYLHLLQDFLDKYDNTPKNLNQYLDDNNMDEAHRLMHTLSGVAGTIGAEALQKIVIDITDILRDKKIIDADMLTDFHNTFTDTTNNLESWFNRENALVASTTSLSTSQEIMLDKTILDHIILLLEEGKPEAHKVLAQLNLQNQNNVNTKLISLALEYAQRYDFSNALANLSKLKL